MLQNNFKGIVNLTKSQYDQLSILNEGEYIEVGTNHERIYWYPKKYIYITVDDNPKPETTILKINDSGIATKNIFKGYVYLSNAKYLLLSTQGYIYYELDGDTKRLDYEPDTTIYITPN